jgi:redox-sensitive bicupin YhaK (pirin superfamily)
VSTRGEPRGPAQRLIDPTTIGELIKPFVLLDYADLVPKEPFSLAMHPHSGIATVTLLLNGGLEYEDTTGSSGSLADGSVEWMRAGTGVWHSARIPAGQRLRVLQLWITLPTGLEEAPPETQYIPAQEVQTHGPARITLGRHAGVRSPVRSPESVNYLHVTLRRGERWAYQPPAGHEVAWVFPYTGGLETPDPIAAGELAVFEESNAPLEFTATGETDFVLGSAIKHPHDLVLGYFSIHSSTEILERSAKQIARIGDTLRAAGKITADSLQTTVARVRPGSW